MFNDIKQFYESGIYTLDNVKTFVQAKFITADQYEQITGEVYS